MAYRSENYLAAAFHRTLKKVRRPRRWFLTLVEHVPFYGGPEEGGWWGSDTDVIAYQVFPSKRLAEEARAAVEALAAELSTESQRNHGDYLLRQTEWLDERGLDDSFLPEVDGHSTYSVYLSRQIPRNSRGCREWS